MSRSLFEEAIADAKQLREAAEINAKNAIIEAVTPRIREFIEKQLVGDTENNNDSDFLEESIIGEDQDDEEIALDESALRSLTSLMRGEAPANTQGGRDLAALSEAFDSLSEDEQKRLLTLVKEGDLNIKDQKKEEKKSDKVDDAYEINLDELRASIVSEMKSKANGAKMKGKHMDMEEELYELDEMMMDDDELEEADLVFSKEELESLGIDSKALQSMSLGVKVSGEEGEEEEDTDVEVSDEEAEAAPEEEPEPEGEPVSETVYEIDENMLRRELARLREAKSRKKNGGASSSHKAAAGAFGGGTLEGEVLEVELNKAAAKSAKMKSDLMKEARENRALRQQLNDYRGAVETLREQLSDLNLFNAKLLYVNKILQNKDVAPNQRRSIIEALDGAANLREAKLLYESLSTSISSKNASLNESVKHTAGLASRPTTSASARMSGAGEVDRWAILAGIK
jgi:hypothetical protein